MDIENIKDLEYIYFLDRNAWSVNDPEALIVEMEVMEEEEKTIAYAEQGHETLQFELTEGFFTQATKGKRKYLFKTRQDAQAHYNEELKKEIRGIQAMSKDSLAQMFFKQWQGDVIRDESVTETMKAKIKAEFGVDV
ncbi:hypothetical protein [Evansella clarkii]|uniref:hypothetical protein n=1 Tax=Evansella clarkii TaxID=79879 RepID=UPI000998A5A3|nr:hypothetical protein [Evansella clarkii]